MRALLTLLLSCICLGVWAQAPVIQASGPLAIDRGQSVTLSLNQTGQSVVWYREGQQVGNQPTYTASKAGRYSAVLTVNGIPYNSNSVTITVKQTVSALAAQPHNYVAQVTALYPNLRSVADAASINFDSASVAVQYIDGIGRSAQTVAPQASPGKKDTRQIQVYDPYSRVEKEYLAYVAGTDGLYSATAQADQQQFYTVSNETTAGVVRDPNPFLEHILEGLPKARSVETGAPGTVWQIQRNAVGQSTGLGKTAQARYLGNATQTVRRWQLPPVVSDVRSTAFWPAGKLALTQSRDEQGSLAQTFTDQQDRVLLKRTLASVQGTDSLWAETYYLYDVFGRLAIVIQPEGVKALKALPEWNNPTATVTLSADILDKWCFQYKYDGRGRVIESKVPGGGWLHTVYNRADLPVLVQDANQRALTSREWLFTKYDQLKRPILTGILRSQLTRDSLQKLVDAPAAILFENRATTATGYTWQAFPTATDTTLLTVSWYDDYDFNRDGTPDAAFTTRPDFPDTPWPSAHGLQTGGRVRILRSNKWLRSSQFYDDKGRVLFSAAQNHIGGADSIWTRYSFAGWVLKTTRKHTAVFPDTSYTLLLTDSLRYDHAGRLLEQWHRINQKPAQQLSALTYNELGQVSQKKLHRYPNGTYQQWVDFRYNIRGWLTGVNPTSLARQSGEPLDLWQFDLYYENHPDSAHRQYNGNISGQRFRYLSNTTYTVFYGYNYCYDRMNRVLDGRWTQTGYTGLFNERSISYDLNGNILGLTRTGPSPTAGDSVKYTYQGNQLWNTYNNYLNGSGAYSVLDYARTTTAQEYFYDANGNLTRNLNFTLAHQRYNHLNLPDSIRQTSGRYILYTYDAAGRKLQAKSWNTTQFATISYAGGIHYNGSTLDFIQTAEGRLDANPDGSFTYVYSLQDHLGSTRIGFADIDNDGDADQVHRFAYMPFGFRVGNHTSETPGYENRYQYNGKELQLIGSVTTGLLDYGARQYDPTLGRWHVVDPLADKFWDFSPYNYVYNNPLRFKDTDGREGKDVIYSLQRNKEGKVTGITVSATVYITGPNASAETAAALNKRAAAFFKPGEAKNGIKVSFSIRYEYSENMSRELLSPGENLLVFNEKKSKGRDRSHVETRGETREEKLRLTGNYGEIYSEDADNIDAIIHETGHLIGLKDRYYEGDFLAPMEGFENDFMANNSGGVFGQFHYDSYGEHAVDMNKRHPKTDTIHGYRMIDQNREIDPNSIRK